LYNYLFAAIIFSTVTPYLQPPYSQLISYTNSTEIRTPLLIMTNVQSEAEASEVVEKKGVTLENLDPPNSESTSLEKVDLSTGVVVPTDDIEYPHGVKLASILIALCFAVFLVALDQTIVATAIPRITDRFNSIQDIGWYGSAYFLTSTAFQPSFGRIYKIFSVRIPSLSLHCGVASTPIICS
jgi:hypothetical protein